MTHNPNQLLDQMQDMVDSMRKILRDPKRSADVQISDINDMCWVMVELAMKLRGVVFKDLHGIEGE